MQTPYPAAHAQNRAAHCSRQDEHEQPEPETVSINVLSGKEVWLPLDHQRGAQPKCRDDS